MRSWTSCSADAVAIVAILLVPTCTTNGPFDACGESNFTRSLKNVNEYYMVSGMRLVGGRDSERNAWPWTSQVLYRSGAHRCGAALIDARYLVTAAHCFSKTRNPERYVVRLGGHERGTGERHLVRNISIHPFYNLFMPSSYDLALVRITPPANLSEIVRTVCLPLFPVPENKICIVTGWGQDSENGERAKVLKEIHVPVIGAIKCNSPEYYHGRIHPPSMFCAGYSQGGTDACQGDSGGPLFCEVRGRWELQGLVSWGSGCARARSPGVYVNIPHMVPWIKLQMLLIG